MAKMAGLLPQRRLMLLFLILTVILGFYMLRTNLDMKLRHIEEHVTNHDTLHDGNNSLHYQLNLKTKPLIVRQEEERKEAELKALTRAVVQSFSKQSLNSSNSAAEVKSNSTKASQELSKQVIPTEPDFLGDRYTTDDVPPQTNCPTSIRKKVSQTQFAGKFLANVPVLQWAKHFSQQEYERLSSYQGAHGWGSVNADVLNNSLAILNSSANRLMFDDWERKENRSQCIRCAVVGNGGILKGSKKGQEIDQHDYVFRTNGAVIKGFEEDVGTHTSHYTFSTNTMRNSMRSYASAGYHGPPLDKDTRYVFLPDHDRDYILMMAAATHTAIDKGPEKSNTPPVYFGKDVTAEKFKIYHPDFVRYLRNRFLRSHTLDTRFKDIYRPSTGAVMLLAALHTCDQV
ncbi:hypothetical protein NFI96_023267 [Prochilodus magdalenae]|nr:hypothetical protein NFI96_023267 [Prochilodus magdalenae]